MAFWGQYTVLVFFKDFIQNDPICNMFCMYYLFIMDEHNILTKVGWYLSDIMLMSHPCYIIKGSCMKKELVVLQICKYTNYKTESGLNQV